MMMIMILVIKGTYSLSSIAFPASEKKSQIHCSSLAWGISCEKDTNFAPFWSSPLNFGATENSKGTELDQN